MARMRIAHALRPGRPVALALAALLVLAAACSDDGGSASGEASTIDVGLKDFELTLSSTSVPPGTITFVGANAGPSVHEFEVFRVDEGVDPATLPVESGVAITDGLAPIEEIEDIAPGTAAKLALELEPGAYAVICNLPEHYGMGMHATFTVG
jgi:uncharacterized cupredoxin-like copper-binding protein